MKGRDGEAAFGYFETLAQVSTWLFEKESQELV